MTAVAWVFPGQGSQHPGMGQDLVERFPAARRLFERADELLRRPLSRLCLEGTPEELGRTQNSQPAIFLMSMACLEVARESGLLTDEPAFVAGHSLGEYSALCAAGAISFDDGIRLVEERGRLTQAAADATDAGMAAVLQLDDATVAAVCEEAGVEVCNFNSPGQVVIGGEKAKLERACALALERGARRAVVLDVGGAFHSSLMAPAQAGMRQAISSIVMSRPRFPYVANDRASVLEAPAEIGEELVFQLTHPVRWVECVQFMTARGVSQFVEIGPGNVLTGLIKRIASGATLRNLNTAGSMTA
jgi:[acyl-carrier-protein] S-malonyltransferase